MTDRTETAGMGQKVYSLAAECGDEWGVEGVICLHLSRGRAALTLAWMGLTGCAAVTASKGHWAQIRWGPGSLTSYVEDQEKETL